MKKILLFSVIFIVGLNLFGQPAVKVFAYEQDNLPGTRPAGVVGENGKPIKKAAPKKNYFIYMSFKQKYSVKPMQIFIKGKSYEVGPSALRKAPVEYVDNMIPNNGEKTVLVPATDDKVLEVPVAELSLEQKKTSNIQNLTAKNDVVVAYMWNNKKYYAILQHIKQMPVKVNE
jgi:hypothetical protein